MTESVDCAVIGAGVVGLAIAKALAESGREVIVLEAGQTFGMGASSRNSEVLHAGIYYPTGSLKASMCVDGQAALYRYCEHKSIEHRRAGKIIVASTADQISSLERYAALGAANGVRDLQLLSAEEVRKLEPAIRCAAGLLSPATGIIDSHGLMFSYITDLEARGGIVAFRSPVVAGELRADGVLLNIGGPSPTQLLARAAINAAGLEAQAVSRSLTGVPDRCVPERFLAKGHYFTLSGASPFRRLIYPIAGAGGLGVHVTIDLAGRVRFGPDVQWIDRVDYDFGPGRATAFINAIREYYPDIDPLRLQPGYVGIRSKLAGEGQVSADFCIQGPDAHRGAPYVALYGIESPGLTASLAVANHVRQLLE